MKFFTDKSITKKIIILIVMILLFNFTMPNYVHADVGGVLFNPLAQLLVAIGDVIINLLESNFVGSNRSMYSPSFDNNFDFSNPSMAIYYSPAIIFSDMVPLFSINFIGDYTKYEKDRTTVYGWDKIDPAFSVKYIDKDGMVVVASDGIEQYLTWRRDYMSSSYQYNGHVIDSVIKSNYGEAHVEMDTIRNIAATGVAFAGITTPGVGLPVVPLVFGTTLLADFIGAGDATWFVLFFTLTDGNEYIIIRQVDGWDMTAKNQIRWNAHQSQGDRNELSMSLAWATENGKLGQETNVERAQGVGHGKNCNDFFVLGHGENAESVTITVHSSGYYLQDIIATWYKIFRNISLVALLTILIYIGIRMLLTTTSSEKAKYKKMIINWFVALLMIFFLQYFMLFIITVTESIIKLLSTGSFVTESGADVLMSRVRSYVGNAEDFTDIFGYLIEYIVLVVFTCTFTIQYAKRTMYMAFFTMIAPLVSLTYPLDKIKDGQAQAFSIWLKEYLFNAILPVMHITIYYVFVSSATELMETNIIFALIALGFLTPAEKFFRKMFGFDKATSASPMAAAAGGALMMNAINKMGSKAPSGSNKSDKDTSGGGKVRTKDKGVVGGGPTQQQRTQQQPTQQQRTQQQPTQQQPTQQQPTQQQPTQQQPTQQQPTQQQPTQQQPTQQQPTQQQPTQQRTPPTSPKKPPKIISGLKNMAGNRFRKMGKGLHNIGKNALYKAPGALLGATLGLAAGVASGDMSKAFTYAAGGAAALGNASGKMGNTMEGIVKEDFGEFHEGAMGAEEYANWQSDKEFYKSDEWRKMRNNSDLRGNYKTAKELRNAVQTCRSYGITDTKKMTKALKRTDNPDEAAQAIKLSEKISRSDWNDPSTRASFLAEKRIPNDPNTSMYKVLEDLL